MTPHLHAPLVIRRGKLLCFRILDIGDEVLLDAAEKCLLGPGADARRLKLSRAASQALSFKAAPLEVALGVWPMPVLPGGGSVATTVFGRIFDHGNVAIRFELEVPPGTTLEALTPLCDDLYESELLSVEARKHSDALVTRLGSCVVRPHAWADVETYTVIFVEELEGQPPAAQVLSDDAVLKLLLGERSKKPLSENQRTDMRRHVFSYLEDDLVVIDWDSAFVLEPSGSRDVPDVLELACGQLQGLRFYDQVMDLELQRIYDAVEKTGLRSGFSVFTSRYDRLARDAQERWLDMTEVVERVENSIKVVGDFYLARVYRGALERCRVPEWQKAVYRKQALIAQVYDLLRGQADTRRSTALELAIVFLIVLEIVMALVRPH